MTHGRNRAVLVAFGAAAFACGGSTPSPTDDGDGAPLLPPPVHPPAHLIHLTPTKPRIDAGTTVRITATATDANQQMLPFARVTWISSQPEVAAVDSTGLVRGLAPGYVTVTAMSGAALAYATVHVMRNGQYPDLVRLLPEVQALSACGSVQMTAATVPDVASDHFVWRSSDDDVMTVSAAGLVRGVAAGAANLFVAWLPDTTRRATRTFQVTAC